MDEIARIYAARKEPVIYKGDEILDKKELGGRPCDKRKSKVEEGMQA